LNDVYEIKGHNVKKKDQEIEEAPYLDDLDELDFI
jgi:hypothetical protein